jgi:hypothetical protein
MKRDREMGEEEGERAAAAAVSRQETESPMCDG